MSDIEDDDDLVDYEALGRLCANTHLRIGAADQPPLVQIDLASLAAYAGMAGRRTNLLVGQVLVAVDDGTWPASLGPELLITVEPPPG